MPSFKERFADWYEHESATTNYDVFMRMPALLYFAFVLWLQAHSIIDAAFVDHGLETSLWIATIAARSAAFAVVVAFAGLTLVRSKPVARSKGIWPRVTAFAGVACVFGFPFLTRPEPVFGWEVISTLLIAVSGILTCFVVLRLGRSFSTMPEARKLVTTGVYAYVRHPLYVAEEIAVLGVLLQYRSPAALALVAAQIFLQVQRMRCEETVLTDTFPEYNVYAASTARLIPGVY